MMVHLVFSFVKLKIKLPRYHLRNPSLDSLLIILHYNPNLISLISNAIIYSWPWYFREGGGEHRQPLHRLLMVHYYDHLIFYIR